MVFSQTDNEHTFGHSWLNREGMSADEVCHHDCDETPPPSCSADQRVEAMRECDVIRHKFKVSVTAERRGK